MPSLLDLKGLGGVQGLPPSSSSQSLGLLDFYNKTRGGMSNVFAETLGNPPRAVVERGLLSGNPQAQQQANAETMARQQQEAAIRSEKQKKMQAAAQAEQEAMIVAAAAQQAQQAGIAALGGQPNENTTIGQLDAAKKASERAALEVKHQAEVAKGAEAIVKAGGTEKDLEGWAKFTDEFDLTTIGMALLASNDGSGNIVSNLGQALMLGRQASEFRKDKAAAGQAAARKEQREIAKDNRAAFKTENEVSTAIYNANTNAMDKEDAARSRALRDRNDTIKAQAAKARADAAAMEAAAKDQGFELPKNKNATAEGLVVNALRQNGVEDPEIKETAKAGFVTSLATQLLYAKKTGAYPELSDSELADALVRKSRGADWNVERNWGPNTMSLSTRKAE